jgi:CubicO group peptidase (beta-lactamase class C family)
LIQWSYRDHMSIDRRVRVVSRVVFLLTLAASCHDTAAPAPVQLVPDHGADYIPAAEWRTAVPAATGFDAPRMDAVKRDVTRGRYGTIDGFLVVRYGYLVVEQYDRWSRNSPHTMQSVTKSVTSLLTGIALAQHPRPLDTPVLDVFARYPNIENVDVRKRALTLRNLLTMRTNMDFWEQPYPGSPLDQLNRSSADWVKFVLDRPMTGAPGTAWAYNSGAAIVIGGVIRELTGDAPDVFARRELFEPLGITGETWYRSPFDALPHSGGGLGLKPIDLARIGYLVLRNGRWGTRQVVPADWMSSSVQPVTRGAPVFFSQYGSGYGYFWWTFPVTRGGSDAGVIAASGSGGQWLFVVPSLDLVVAVVATNGNGLDLLYEGVLPALGRAAGSRSVP